MRFAMLVLIVCLCFTSGAIAEIAPTPLPTPAPTPAPVINPAFSIEATLGYEGLLVMGRMNPGVVTVKNLGDANFEGTLGVNVFYDHTLFDRYEAPLTLPSGTEKRVSLPLIPRLNQDMYAFELIAGGQIVAEARVKPARMVAPETLLIGVLSATPQTLQYMNQSTNAQTLRGETWQTVSLSADAFPESTALLDAFSMLVIDGIDPRTFTPAAQSALSQWLTEGGIAVLSGGAKAAAGYPFFSQWTGLTPGALAEAGDITPALLARMGITGSPAGKSIWVNEMPAQGAAIAEGEMGLLSLHSAGDGLVYAAAFDLSGATLAGWSSMQAFWPRMLRTTALSAYTALADRLQMGTYDPMQYTVRNLMNNLTIPNEDSGLPVLIVLLAYLLVIGLVGYLLLKKFDRREWMWALVPAAAVGFALVLLLMSGQYTMNDPLALTATRIKYNEAGADAQTFIGVAAAERGEMLVQVDGPQLPTSINEEYYYYDDGTGDGLFRPLQLRQRLVMGDQPAIGFAPGDVWTMRLLQIAEGGGDHGMVKVRVWMETDGMHGEVTNDSPYPLSQGVFVGNFGYCFVDDLLPGQTLPFALLLPDAPVNYNQTGWAQPGVMYTALDINQFSRASQGYIAMDDYFYEFLNAIRYVRNENGTIDYGNSTKARINSSLLDLFAGADDFYAQAGNGHFMAITEGTEKIAVSLNGQPIARTGQTAIIGAHVEMEPISPTGVVYYHEEMILPELMIDQGDALPTLSDQVTQFGQQDLDISSPLALRFVLPHYGEYRIDEMAIWSSTYGVEPLMHLYNHQTDAWDPIPTLTIMMTGKDWAPYIDEDGSIYVRYLPGTGTGRYDTMPRPSIALKGEVE
jgi:hypothetical protein